MVKEPLKTIALKGEEKLFTNSVVLRRRYTLMFKLFSKYRKNTGVCIFYINNKIFLSYNLSDNCSY